MRIRPVAAAALLLLPSIAEAQARLPHPTTTGRRPTVPVPASAQPPEIARALAYTRSRYSLETYPLISRISSPGFSATSPSSTWTTFGTGTRLDWRLTQYVSWTFDVTASYLGGSANTETAELGLRLRPEVWEHRVRPFADVRVGYEHVGEFNSQPLELGMGPASSVSGTSRYSRGFGALAGAGVEYALTNTFALTSAVSALRSNLVAYRYTGVSVPNRGDNFTMMSYRLAVGLKWNPVYKVRSESETNLINRKTP
jgi:opacity protein-like surface antigen